MTTVERGVMSLLPSARRIELMNDGTAVPKLKLPSLADAEITLTPTTTAF